ncbi:acyltransferase [Bradyrhizobium sp. CCBAU 51753]|uniref:acyltransferase family protein n=1 Tax=Bradyrhizobium sp. CCBAU 51753 TaxID=1325100 RepID=UPI00188BD69E|nr:acyltransferase [Bradyrhizobium sp. CCBAU 51753]QOZ25286.1 acyltransferase [Bradyrhizobium sp. CCBAU 51753]
MDIQRSAARPELRALTGLRGVAATVVVLGHFNPPLPYHLEHFFHWYTAAVDLFFCLSGFTLSYVYSGKSFHFSTYLIARIARIYPLYLVTLLTIGAAYTIPDRVSPETYPASVAMADFARQLLMVNDWPIVGSGVHWNAPAWSISIEWLCYLLLFPVLLRLKPPSENTRFLLLVALSAATYAILLFFEGRLTNGLPYGEPNAWSQWAATLRGASAFAVGWIAYWSYRQRDGIHSLCSRYSTAIWLCFGAVLTLSYLDTIRPQTVVLFFPFLVLTATDACSQPSRVLGSAPIHYLGDISYSIYMVHFAMFIVFAHVVGRSATWTAPVYVALIATTVVVSALTYWFIERPSRGAIRRSRR